MLPAGSCESPTSRPTPALRCGHFCQVGSVAGGKNARRGPRGAMGLSLDYLGVLDPAEDFAAIAQEYLHLDVGVLDEDISLNR